MSALSLGRSVVQFMLNLFVASLVAPGEYGLLTFTLPFVTLAALMTDLGLASAVVRAPHVSDRQARAAFTLTLLVGAIAGAILALSSDAIEIAVKMPGLGSVMVGMALSLYLTIACSVPRALLERDLRYGEIAGKEALSVFASVFVAIGCGFAGMGIWSLVVYNIAANALRLGLFGWPQRHNLVFNLHLADAMPLLSFGLWVFATNLLGFLARNADNVLIGAYLGSAALGLYGLAYQFMTLPLIALSWPASGVLLATLSRRDGAARSGSHVVGGIVGLTAALSFPLLGYVATALRFPLTALLGPGWSGLLPLLPWLAAAGAIQSVAAYNGAVLLAAGRARLHFALSLGNAAVLLALFLCVLPYGLGMFVIAYAFCAGVLSALFLAVMLRVCALPSRDFLRALFPAVAAGGAGLAGSWAIQWAPIGGAAGWIVHSGTYAAAVGTVFLAMRRRLSALLRDARA